MEPSCVRFLFEISIDSRELNSEFDDFVVTVFDAEPVQSVPLLHDKRAVCRCSKRDDEEGQTFHRGNTSTKHGHDGKIYIAFVIVGGKAPFS